MDAAQWVYDTVAKMDPDEARMFALFVADDLHINEIVNNQRVLKGLYDEVQKSITDDLAPYFLRELRKGTDPEVLVAQAAAVSIAKDAGDWNWWNYQERDHGRFGRMTRGQYRSQIKAINAGNKADKLKLKALQQGKFMPSSSGTSPDPRELRAGLRAAQAQNLHDINRGMRAPVSTFNQNYHRMTNANQVQSGAAEAAGRVEATGDLVTRMGILGKSPSTVAAGQLASLSGRYGPEAEKVIGPSMRKTAYRYRGTERTPDQQLEKYQAVAGAAVNRNEGKPYSTPLPQNQRVYASQQAAKMYLLGIDFRDGKTTGKSRVPKGNMASLHRQSGRVTPSEGIMIDANGDIISQAVGFGEDHYLPFNLKNLGALKGGSYVRTRESGGLTAEDVYAGLMSGARSVSVVSNSGMFTMHFDDDLRGGRRYNDKAKQMVGRYEHTLDAIQSNKVANPAKAMTPEIRARIRQETEDKLAGLSLSEEEMDKEVQIATNKAAMKPQLSDKQKAEIDRHAADIERNEGAQAAKRYRYAQEDELLNEQAGQNYRLDGEGYAAALDALKEQFPYYIDDVEYTTRQKMVGNASGIQGSNFTNKEDYAYVKPRYNRPAAARSGYFDTTITGEGKRAADRTGYQNWAVQQHRTTDKQEGNVSARRVSETPEPGTPGAPTPTPDSDNDTPSSNLQQRSRQVRERRRESERQEEMRGAVENDAATWMPVNVEGKSLANATEHPNLTKYKDASPEQRKTMLDDPDFVDKLDADLTKVKGTPAAQEWRDLNSARVGRDRHDKAGMVREKYAKPLDYTEHIKGRRSPDRPGGISEEAAREVLRNDPSIQDMVRTQSDFQLRQQSDVARKARTDAKDSYEDKIAERHEKTVVKLEQARAIKAMMANNASPDRPVVHYQDPGNPGNPSGTTGGNRPGFSPSSGGASTNPKGPHLAAFRRQLDELLMEHGEEPDLNDRINRLKGHFITNTSLTDDDMEQTVVDAKFDDMDKRMRPS